MSDASITPPDGVPASPAAPPLSPGEAKLRAALQAPGVAEAMLLLEQIEDEPPPAAPDPIVVLPEKGGEILIADVEAAVAYVEPTAPQATRVPHHTLTRVHVDDRLDPRKQVTERRLRSEVLPPAPEPPPPPSPHTQTPARMPAPAPLPLTADVPSSRPPPPSSTSTGVARSGPTRAPRRGVLGAVFLGSGGAAVLIFLALRFGSPPDQADVPVGATGPTTVANVNTHASGAGGAEATWPRAASTGAATTGNTVPAAALTGAPTTTGAVAMSNVAGAQTTAPTGIHTAAAPPTTSSPKPPPRLEDPYVDAAAPPAKTAATPEPTAPPAPTAPTTVSSAPTVAPAVTTAAASTSSTARPFAPFVPEKD